MRKRWFAKCLKEGIAQASESEITRDNYLCKSESRINPEIMLDWEVPRPPKETGKKEKPPNNTPNQQEGKFFSCAVL
ncbi:hypothetical protein CDAR_9881 [Caerostris darwini]|uniref:Uncharacterized protein n=1 Tax=Caerostris darwini TaxID=1538125 RepID=A0AAV4R1E8_9ARAC|nr:hypothetical protein CDAR_9881 [Caerostris darwini]